MRKQFLKLLRSALTEQLVELPLLTDDEWRGIFRMACKQGVAGLIWTAVEMLPDSNKPPKDVADEWQLLTRYIEQQNRKLNYACVRISNNFRLGGISSLIMKGQGCGSLYHRPLRRSTGDIDVWMDGGRDAVNDYIHKYFPEGKECGDLHGSVMLNIGVSMELHQTPSHTEDRNVDKALQRWYKSVAVKMWGHVVMVRTDNGDEQIYAPTALLNSVFLLSHFFNHFSFEGAGLKPVVDIYFMMLRNISPLGDVPREVIEPFIPMYKALTWIFLELGMPRESLWVEPDEKMGRLLLDDILNTGIIGTNDFLQGPLATSKPRKFLRRMRRGYRLRSLIGNEWYKIPLRSLGLFRR